MQDLVLACARSVVRGRGVMRARDRLKAVLALRLLDKALFYIGTMVNPMSYARNIFFVGFPVFFHPL